MRTEYPDHAGSAGNLRIERRARWVCDSRESTVRALAREDATYRVAILGGLLQQKRPDRARWVPCRCVCQRRSHDSTFWCPERCLAPTDRFGSRTAPTGRIHSIDVMLPCVGCRACHQQWRPGPAPWVHGRGWGRLCSYGSTFTAVRSSTSAPIQSHDPLRAELVAPKSSEGALRGPGGVENDRRIHQSYTKSGCTVYIEDYN